MSWPYRQLARDAISPDALVNCRRGTRQESIGASGLQILVGGPDCPRGQQVSAFLLDEESSASTVDSWLDRLVWPMSPLLIGYLLVLLACVLAVSLRRVRVVRRSGIWT